MAIRKLTGQIEQFMISRNRCPTTEDLVAARVLQGEPHDPWGSALSIKCPGERDAAGVDIVSFGPDKSESTDDDIRSWQLP
jgi:hypothetical protein